MATRTTMGQDERLKLCIEYLDERDIMLGPRALFDNLDADRTVTFAVRTVYRDLREAADRGLLERVETEHGERGKSIYYRVTDRGRAFAAGELEESDESDE